MKIQENIPLAQYTTFKIGGPARYFVEVSAEEALLEAMKFARKNKLEVFVLGGGSNVLVSDDGFDGLVIKLVGSKSPIGLLEPELVECWAGDSLASAVNFARENSLSGLEWAAGIPGTIGGAIRGNAGAYGSDMGDVVESVRALKIPNNKLQISNKFQILKSKFQNRLKIKKYNLQDCRFGYRDSIFKQNKNLIILSCVLKLEKGDKNEIEKKTKEVLGNRSEKLPCDFSAGSFFQNPKVSNPELVARFERDVKCQARDGKIPAGWIIDELGLRGKKIGGAMVSEKHANFVVNIGNAKAEDVVMLTSFIKQQARTKLGVHLQEEVQYVGF